MTLNAISCPVRIQRIIAKYTLMTFWLCYCACWWSYVTASSWKNSMVLRHFFVLESSKDSSTSHLNKYVIPLAPLLRPQVWKNFFTSALTDDSLTSLQLLIFVTKVFDALLSYQCFYQIKNTTFIPTKKFRFLDITSGIVSSDRYGTIFQFLRGLKYVFLKVFLLDFAHSNRIFKEIPHITNNQSWTVLE